MELEFPLNKTQIEILHLFSREMPEEDLLEIKRILVRYLSEKSDAGAAKLWDEKGWTDDDMERLAHTPCVPHT